VGPNRGATLAGVRDAGVSPGALRDARRAAAPGRDEVGIERTGALGVEAAAVDDRAAENTPVPGEELARRVDDDVGAELDRPER
jgi:hypothetical protein